MSIELRRGWYVVYSKPHQEETAQYHLRAKGLEAFFPKLILPSSVKTRKRITALFPNYLFVRMDIAREFQYVTWSPGVKRLVCFDDAPVPIDEEIIAFLKDKATAEGLIAAQSNLKVGQEVQIQGGPFDGLAGIIQAPPDAKGRVRILMTLLSRQTYVQVPLHFVKCEWMVLQDPVSVFSSRKPRASAVVC